MPQKYDTIGVDYSNLRRSDPRIAKTVHDGLGEAKTVLNVGAGAGSYEPEDKIVVAVEPSFEMISQRTPDSESVVRARAEDLPFAEGEFDASMAILTIHHWFDKRRGLSEMRRVTGGNVVLLTFDAYFDGFWLLDYFPELAELDKKQMPHMSDYESWIGSVEISPVSIPYDCVDGFLCAYWRRPEAYLDADIRAAISSFWALGDLSDGLKRLEADLKSGAWRDRYGWVLESESLDCGYRLVVSRE